MHGGPHAWRVTMSAVAEVLSTVAPNPAPRGSDLPTCPVCADSMVAAEASAYLTDNVISYLWTCDTCGYGFVNKQALTRFACNLGVSLSAAECRRAPNWPALFRKIR